MRHLFLSLFLTLASPVASIAQENPWDTVTDADKLTIIEIKIFAKQAHGGGPNAETAGWKVVTGGYYPAIKSPDLETTGLIASVMLEQYEKNLSTYETCRDLQKLKAKLETMRVLDVGGPISQETYLALSKNTLVNRPVSTVFREMQARLTKDIAAAKENEIYAEEIPRLTREIKELDQESADIDGYIRKGNSTGDSRTAAWWKGEVERKRSEQSGIRQQRERKQALLSEYQTKSTPLPMQPAWYAGTGTYVKSESSSYNVNAESLLKFSETLAAKFETIEQQSQQNK